MATIKKQVRMVFDLNKCLGCHTCTMACKTQWTDGRIDVPLENSSGLRAYLTQGQLVARSDALSILKRMCATLTLRNQDVHNIVN